MAGHYSGPSRAARAILPVLKEIVMTRASNLLRVLFGIVASVFAAYGTAGTDPAPRVVGWVAPYAAPQSAAALDADPRIGRTLTHIGLQFWNPSADGKRVVLAPHDASGTPLDAAWVAHFRDWARARNIAVLLTVYNNSQVLGQWDWALARRAFKDHRRRFIRVLVREMDRWQLDGIDLDLEGSGALDADRADYARFVRELAAVLHKRGKQLTVDSFHSPCHNAPNMAWWQDWRGAVDAIHVMGYQDLDEASEERFVPPGRPPCAGGAAIFRYSWQLGYGLRAGYRVDQIVLGVPTWVDTWGVRGAPVITHLDSVRALGAGVALWDLQLSAPAWRRSATWDALLELRQSPGRGWESLVAPVAGH